MQNLNLKKVKQQSGILINKNMYDIYFGNAVKKDLKNLSENIRKKVDEIFSVLSNSPSTGESLRGEFLGYYSYHFRVSGVDYRIIYSIKSTELVILIILVGTRENIYKQLKRRL